MKFDSSFDEFKSPDITVWKLTRSEIEHENNLINHRLTWLNTSQGFFFAMFGLVYSAAAKGELKEQTYQAPFILGTIAVLALYFCISVRSAVGDAEKQLDKLSRYYNKLCVAESFSDRLPDLHYREGRWTKRLLVLENLPIMFLFAWLFLLVAIVFDALGHLRPELQAHGMLWLVILLSVVFVASVSVIMTSRHFRTRYKIAPLDK